MLPVADLPKNLQGISYQPLKYINSHIVVGYYLTSITRHQVIRNLIILCIISIIDILKVGPSSTLFASILFINNNYNILLVLEYNPVIYIIVGLFSNSSGYSITFL